MEARVVSRDAKCEKKESGENGVGWSIIECSTSGYIWCRGVVKK